MKKILKLLLILLLLTACSYPEDYSILDDSTQMTSLIYVENRYQNIWQNHINDVKEACHQIDNQIIDDLLDDGYAIVLTNQLLEGQDEILGRLYKNEHLIMISFLAVEQERLETTLFHELGHYLDVKCQYSQTKEFQNLYDQYKKDNHFQSYYQKNKEEFFAESYAKFLQNNLPDDIFYYFDSLKFE